MKPQYNKVILIQTIKDFYNKFHKAPFRKDCLKHGLVSGNVYQRHFGSWSNALRESGIPFKEKNKPILVNCKKCNKEFCFSVCSFNHKSRKSKNTFCSLSCAASYNNTNKQYGTRRSKLETAIENLLKIDYPNLNIEFNSKTAIKSELDIYFPDLKFAIELNGIVHYEPIFGKDKFNLIVDNDNQKIISCFKQGIELAIIDTSQCKKVNDKTISKYYQYVKELIELVIHRLNYN